MNRHFSKEDIQMANKHEKIVLIHMQIETTMTSLHAHLDGYKKWKRANVGEDVEELESS